MKYYLFLFCLFASSSSMALLDDQDNSGEKSFSQGSGSFSSSSSPPEDRSAKRARDKRTEAFREQGEADNFSTEELFTPLNISSQLQTPSQQQPSSSSIALLDDQDNSEKRPFSQCSDSSSSSSSLPEDRSAKRARDKGTEAAREQSETDNLSTEELFASLNIPSLLEAPSQQRPSSSSIALLDDQDNSEKRSFSQLSGSSSSSSSLPSAKRVRNKRTEAAREQSDAHDFSTEELFKPLNIPSPLQAPSPQQPSSSSSVPCDSTDIPKTFSHEVHTLNSPLDFNAILENSESIILKLKFNFTPTVDQLSLLTNRLPFLRDLDLSGTAVTDVSPLASLTNLHYLDLSGTAVTDVSPLASLTELAYLDLSGTAILNITSLADLQYLSFFTNIGYLKKEFTPTVIEHHYCHEMLEKVPPTTSPLTENTNIYLRNIAARAEDYLRSTRAQREPFWDCYDPKTRELCLQRASYEIKRSPEIQKHIKDSGEFMNFSGEEGHYAAWIKADMLASIEGRLVMNGQHPSPSLLVQAQAELAVAEVELTAQDLYTRGFSEETARMYKLLYLRYLCKYGVELKPHIIEALKDISYKVMSGDSYATYAPQQRTCYLLRMADSLFRGFSFEFEFAGAGSGEKWRVSRTYDKPEEASWMLQTYQRNARFYSSLFERLQLHLSSELQ